MTIKLPLSVTLPRKKGSGRIWVLNLNSYRNTHFQILNQAKAAYAEIVSLAVTISRGRLASTPPYRFVYTIYPGTGRSFDIANVAPIIQKFTDDALISLGIIPDDNYKIIPSVDYRFGGVDRADPRAELWIECDREAP
jgi:hypothetical protein